jgi:hypothetical protein
MKIAKYLGFLCELKHHRQRARRASFLKNISSKCLALLDKSLIVPVLDQDGVNGIQFF